ncbi:MAG TPA: hypothetical protein VFV79_08410 [Saprospiraceae bacterium]|nr:hypothetical protein [Saprospiraceae bacterium]HEX5171805.1 hypothetical protein [Cyclobacteriaceae bacterium]
MKLRINRPLDGKMKAIVEKRNNRLREFFSSKNLDVELTGDAENPMIVIGQAISVAAYVKNFDLIFLDKSHQGTPKKIFKLTHEVSGTREEVLDVMHESVHVGLFRIQEKRSKLFLAGYNFKDPENRKGRFPVFAREMSIVYKTSERAEEMKGILEEDGYDVEVVKPDLDRLRIHLGFKPAVEYYDKKPVLAEKEIDHE